MAKSRQFAPLSGSGAKIDNVGALDPDRPFNYMLYGNLKYIFIDFLLLCSSQQIFTFN